MITFLKANLASLLASVADYLVTVLAVQLLSADVVIAGVTGTLSGGMIHFFMGRHWVFGSCRDEVYPQASKYLVVWTGSLLLNALGMHLLSKRAGMFYILAKVVTSLLVAVAYNYPLQKKFVFKSNQWNER